MIDKRMFVAVIGFMAGPLLRNEEKFAGGLAGLEVAVGVRSVGERIGMFESELEFS